MMPAHVATDKGCKTGAQRTSDLADGNGSTVLQEPSLKSGLRAVLPVQHIQYICTPLPLPDYRLDRCAGSNRRKGVQDQQVCALAVLSIVWQHIVTC